MCVCAEGGVSVHVGVCSVHNKTWFPPSILPANIIRCLQSHSHSF